MWVGGWVGGWGWGGGGGGGAAEYRTVTFRQWGGGACADAGCVCLRGGAMALGHCCWWQLPASEGGAAAPSTRAEPSEAQDIGAGCTLLQVCHQVSHLGTRSEGIFEGAWAVSVGSLGEEAGRCCQAVTNHNILWLCVCVCICCWHGSHIPGAAATSSLLLHQV